MDKELLIQNINSACKLAGVPPTKAFVEAGVGKDFVVNLRRTASASLTKTADLAAYLGVSISDLVGDARPPTELMPLYDAWAELNDEGRERLAQFAEDLVASGRYSKKDDPAGLDQREA